jgi:DNA-directed RNA polymerase subunit N (RpoN/RPB10)
MSITARVTLVVPLQMRGNTLKKRIEELIERNKRNDPDAVPVRCFICNLPVEKRQRVDKSLMEKNTSLEAIATDLGIAKSSVFRHAKNHLVPQVKDRLLVAVASRPGVLEGVETPEDLRDLNARAELVLLFQKAKALVETTIDNEDFPAVKGFLAEGRQLLELLARLDGKLNGDDPERNRIPVVIVIHNAGPTAAQVTLDPELAINGPVTIDTRAERA